MRIRKKIRMALQVLCLLLVQAFHQTFCQLSPIQVLPDENKLVQAGLSLSPWIFSRTKVDLLVNSLKHKLCIPLSMEAQQSLGAVEISSPFSQQVHHKHIEPLGVKITLELDTNTLDQL
mmetsp:Transcript_15816/g.33207  ORF Transcript_15816/g.33207 Transcript_15816/m.33207 type:complete len:119 (+) Transcript_15816:249-605(+)